MIIHWIKAHDCTQAAFAARHLNRGAVVVLVDAAEVERQDPTIALALSATETARAARFRSPLARAEFCAGRGLVRAMAARALARSEVDIDIATGLYGKPFITGTLDAALAFSISHSAGRVVVAMAREVDIGVDVELSDAPVHRFANLFLTEQEHRIVARLPKAKRRQVLFRLWRIKEAILKAAGYGLSADPRSIEVLLAPDAPFARDASVEWRGRLWRIAEASFDDQTDVTLAWSDVAPVG